VALRPADGMAPRQRVPGDEKRRRVSAACAIGPHRHEGWRRQVAHLIAHRRSSLGASASAGKPGRGPGRAAIRSRHGNSPRIPASGRRPPATSSGGRGCSSRRDQRGRASRLSTTSSGTVEPSGFRYAVARPEWRGRIQALPPGGARYQPCIPKYFVDRSCLVDIADGLVQDGVPHPPPDSVMIKKAGDLHDVGEMTQ